MPERTLNAIKAATDTKALAGGAVSFGGFMVVLTDIMPLFFDSRPHHYNLFMERDTN